MAVEVFEHGAAQGGFSRSDFTRKLHESLPLADSIKQMIECLAMLWAIEQKARVRRDVERWLTQAIVFQVHIVFLAKMMPKIKRTFEPFRFIMKMTPDPGIAKNRCSRPPQNVFRSFHQSLGILGSSN